MASEADLEDAVVRVALRAEPQTTIGTAFPIAPRTLVTCAHVVSGRKEDDLFVQSDRAKQKPILISEILKHPKCDQLDVALLHTTADLSHILPVFTGQPGNGASLAARGFGGEMGISSARTIWPQASGNAQVWYELLGSDVIFRTERAQLLRGDPSRPGDSGGPVFDCTVGAVVGLMLGGTPSGARSFALPIGQAEEGFPELAKALRWNDEHLPRFANALNLAGLQALCRSQIRATISELETKTLLNAARMVKRVDAGRVFSSFLMSTRPVLSVLAAPGSGKTAFLASQAVIYENRSLLLLSRDIDPRWTLPVAIEKSFHSSVAVGPEFSALVARTAADRNEPLILILDAINELPVNDPGEWLSAAITWCEMHEARLVVSCRSELWSLIRDRVPRVGSRFFKIHEAEGIQLSDFSSEEVAEAVRVFGLRPGPSGRIGRHPLMFALAAEMDLGIDGSGAGRLDLIRRFISHRLGPVLRRLNFGTSQPLMRALERLASSLPLTGPGQLKWSEASTLLGNDSIVDALLVEGLLIPAGQSDVRFLHDEVVEALRSIDIDPFSTIQNLVADVPPDAAQLRQVMNKILRYEADDDDEAFTESIATLALAIEETARQNLTMQAMSLFAAMPHLFNSLPSVREPEIDGLCRRILQTAHRHMDSRAHARGRLFLRLVASLVGSAPLPPEKRAEMMLELLPFEDGYLFRLKEFSEKNRRTGNERQLLAEVQRLSVTLRDAGDYQVQAAPSRWLLDMLTHDRVSVREVLGGHLHDHRQLAAISGPDSGTVADVMAALLFLDCSNDVRGTLETFFIADAAHQHVQLLAASYATDLFEFAITEISGQHAAKAVWWVVYATEFEKSLAAQSSAAFEKLLQGDPSVALEAAQSLRSLDKDHVGAWDCLARAVRSGRNEFLSSLGPIPPNRIDEALDIARANPSREAFWMLDKERKPSIERDKKIAALVIEWFNARPDFASYVGGLVESYLYRVGGDVDGVWFKVAEAIARSGNEDARRYLFYFAIPDPTQAGSDVVRRLLFETGLSRDEADLTLSFLDDLPRFGGDAVGSPAWVQRFAEAYAPSPESVREAALERYWLGIGVRTDEERAAAQEAILAHWANLNADQLDAVARKLVNKWRRGDSIAELYQDPDKDMR